VKLTFLLVDLFLATHILGRTSWKFVYYLIKKIILIEEEEDVLIMLFFALYSSQVTVYLNIC
jgi:hypothetical protein